MSSEPWAGSSLTPVTTNGVANPPPPDGCGGGDCGIFFRPFSGNASDGSATGHLYQDNPATPGATYLLTARAGAEANALMGGAELALEFLNSSSNVIAGSVVNLIDAGLFADNGQPFDYKQYTVTATAPSGTATVRARASMIEAMSNPSGGGQAYVIDDFTLSVQSLVRPRITSISIVQPGGGRRILGRGEAARLYTIRAANNLSVTNSWSTLGSSTADASGNLEFLDNAAQAPRFYQLLDDAHP
jgi:hypothetical protein